MNGDVVGGEEKVDASQGQESLVEHPGGQPVEIVKEEVPGGPLLITAYLALWVVLFLFVFFTRRSQEALRGQILRLEEQLDTHIADQGGE